MKSKFVYAIDINPSKQGNFMPISGVQVLSPEEGLNRLKPSSIIVIMNPNYEAEILKILPPNQPWLTLR